jgi:hypothetical protein
MQRGGNNFRSSSNYGSATSNNNLPPTNNHSSHMNAQNHQNSGNKNGSNIVNLHPLKRRPGMTLSFDTLLTKDVRLMTPMELNLFENYLKNEIINEEDGSYLHEQYEQKLSNVAMKRRMLERE